MTRRALGRGLSALLGEVETPAAGLEEIPLELIDPNPLQPRRSFPEAELRELAVSIRSSGVVQPVLLRHAGSRYQLVVGERRWRAAQLAGLDSVPALVREVSDKESLELALTENLLRADLNPIEVANAYGALQEKFGLNHEEIAQRLGIDRTTVTNTLRLLRLPAAVQEMLADRRISAGHARALLALDSAAGQTKLAQMIASQGLSVREVERMVALRAPEAARPKSGPAPAKLDANLRAAVLEMERTLGTRIKISGSEKRGRIEISYFSAQDLNRIFEWIVKR